VAISSGRTPPAFSGLEEATMNKKILTGALAALTLGGALAATTTLPASAAEHWRGHGYDRGWRGGEAGAALLGLSVGAALGGAYAPPAYYAPPRCRVELRWNPYWRGYDRVRVCY
jgi:heme A synthase